MSDTLRDALDAISGCGLDHAEKVSGLREKFPHSILFIDHGAVDERCFSYAFCMNPFLAQDPLPCMSTEFLQWYSKNELIEDQNGELAIYFAKDQPQHVGLCLGQRVISKWGGNPIYEHEIWEVPASYGNDFHRYVRPSKTKATLAWVSFVRNHEKYKHGDINEQFELTLNEIGLSIPAD